MSPLSNGGARERIHALLAERATQALTLEEQRELDTLLASHPEIDGDEFDRTAAELDVFWMAGNTRAMPAALRAKIASAAPDHVTRARRASAVAAPRARGFDLVRARGWLLAAASLAALVAIWPRTETAPSLAEQRERLIESVADEIQLAWTPTVGTFTGDAVWSPSAQRGFLRFRGLAKNDPRVQQYQLWIFDKQQDERYPIDGGVFDIGDDGEVIVPIDAKIAVQELAMLAVTREKPGGVVVSSRAGLVGLAQL
ncbi:MAG: anti-sigma factor domain-containing protein [Planctomycetota bacterium]